MQELLDKLRGVTEEDRNTLPTYSYTKLDVFKKCPMQYKIKYVDYKRPEDESTLAMELGSICHYVLEAKGKMISNGQDIDYEILNTLLLNGAVEIDEKTTKPILGVNELKKKYFEEWYIGDNASGMNYEQKLKVFDKVLHSEMNDKSWQPTYYEMPFEFVYDNRAIFHGFIDRTDTRKENETTIYKVVDYKTSKKIYGSSDLATSMQFGIYSLAILEKFGTLPVESEYRFILIDDRQYALTSGWEKRLIKQINKLLDGIDECKKSNLWTPKPTPLCHWCSYCTTNPNAHQYEHECQYYSLWTPSQKSFEVNKKWDSSINEHAKNERKIFF